MDFIERLFPFDRVGSVDIEKHCFCTGVFDLTNYVLHRGHRRLAIQMNAEDVHPMPGKLDCSRSTKPTGRSKDYCPFIWPKPSLGFHTLLLQGVVTGVFKIARKRGKSKPIPPSHFSLGF